MDVGAGDEMAFDVIGGGGPGGDAYPGGVGLDTPVPEDGDNGVVATGEVGDTIFGGVDMVLARVYWSMK